MIGGLWGIESYFGTGANDGDLYLSAIYQLDDDGTFVEPVPFTGGLLIRKAHYTHIEIFRSGADAPPLVDTSLTKAPDPNA